ncbi:MAG: response regulator [Calditrichaeota bacterium]|nr:MAG: response regulator [Calditrichota bacterium]
MRVLVFESSKDRAKLIQDLLSEYRYKIYVHSRCEHPLNEIRHTRPSLIIVHANTTPKKGLDVLENIKNNPRYRSIPVIFISNFASQELSERIRSFPNVDYLVEPFKIKNFRHIVERWVNFRSLYVN